MDEPKNPRLDLSVAQVAGSAVAAVVAAVLASQLGVYGTVIGAGVVSVVATSGGTVFQHLFRRTGEQIREVTVHAKPKARQVPVHDPRGYGQEGGDATRTRVLRTVTVPTDLSNAGLPDEEFSEATTHGTRVRGWKRSVVAAVVVFVVAMGGITAYELITGDGLGGGRGSTVGTVFRGGGEQHQRQKETPSSQAPEETPGSGSATPGTGTGDGRSPGRDSGGDPGTGTGTGTGAGADGGGASTDPGRTPPTTTDGGSTGGTGEATPTPTPTPTPSGTTGGGGGDEGGGASDGADEDPAAGGDSDGGGAVDSGAQAGTPAL
ncbi:hypothetical protein [Streptomyces sp. Wb2n-11]|uniref:hypothetical protein n=1 Tax=Streptomyces sp. Wb2n-11 TaxID=1030533 RepID=UPI00159EC7E6|nr:hypothetical protein [Streptomyces sp. Wb2n-11]